MAVLSGSSDPGWSLLQHPLVDLRPEKAPLPSDLRAQDLTPLRYGVKLRPAQLEAVGDLRRVLSVCP